MATSRIRTAAETGTGAGRPPAPREGSANRVRCPRRRPSSRRTLNFRTPNPEPLNAFPAVALLATARAALGAAVRIDARREGRDPSAQEPAAAARGDLGALAALLAEQTVRLRLRAVVGPAEGPAAFAQAFEDRVLLDDVAQALALAHQKLLSLYPAVDADLAEAARRAAADARARVSADDPADGLAAFAARLAALTDRLAAA